MPVSAPWQPIEFGAVFVMWVVMMIGMMMPSVAPMILIYARIGRQTAGEGRQPLAASAWFALGYLLSWTAFSLAATSAQWALERAALLTPMMESASNILGGHSSDHRRPLPVDTVEGRMSVATAKRRSGSSFVMGFAARRPALWRSAFAMVFIASAAAGR